MSADRIAEIEARMRVTPRHIPGECKACGASTVEQARTRCRMNSDETGEQWCRGGAVELSDSDTVLFFDNPDYIALEDERIEALMQRSES